MTKEAAIEELKQWLKGETVLSWYASEKLANQLHEKIEARAKQQAIAFNEWFMKLTVEKLTYYIIEKGTDSPIVQYYTREEMYNQFIEHQNKGV